MVSISDSVGVGQAGHMLYVLLFIFVRDVDVSPSRLQVDDALFTKALVVGGESEEQTVRNVVFPKMCKLQHGSL